MAMTAYREQPLLLGPRKSLVGIISQPGPLVPAADRPAVVILNSGIVHRVGSNRMSVSLARTLAAAGISAVRFDLSGLGDSDPRPDGLAQPGASLADIREALDSLEATRQIRRVVLGGLCSGADHSLIYAGSDPRVVGAFLLDPSVPETLRHVYLHYRTRLTKAESWINVLRGKNPLWKAVQRRIGEQLGWVAREPRQPRLEDPDVRAYLERVWRNALATGAQFLAVGSGDHHYYRDQLLDAFPGVPFDGRVRLEFFADSDHMFTLPHHRAAVIRLVLDWIQTTTFRGALPAGERSAELERP